MNYFVKQSARLLMAAALLMPFAPRQVIAAALPAPERLTSSTSSAPLSLAPLLRWSRQPEAVAYELEIFTTMPTKLNNTLTDSRAAFHTTRIFTNAYNPLLSSLVKADQEPQPLWWRVRALDLSGQPLSSFSKLSRIFVSSTVAEMNAPIPLHTMGKTPNSTLLYPVYSWLKQSNAASFEVQLFDTAPEYNEDTERMEVSGSPIATFTSDIAEVYDTNPRYGNEPFYWRVRALQSDGSPLGQWSEFDEFMTSPKVSSTQIAAYGDSITHGGGNVSYGPEDMEYSWLTYLNFPCVNLSQSGDITLDLVSRFEDDVLPFKPEYLLVMIGTNDLRDNEHSTQEAIANIEALRKQCANNDIKPIFLTLPPINPLYIKQAFQEGTDRQWVKKFNDFNRYLCTLPHIDVAAKFAPYSAKQGNLPRSLGLDGLHQNIAGKKLIAKAVNEQLNKAMAEADKLQ